MIMIEVSTNNGATWTEVDFFSRSIFNPAGDEFFGELFLLSQGWVPCIWRYKR